MSMETLGALKGAVVDYLDRNAPGTPLEGALLVSEFPGGRQAMPPRQPVIAVGVERVELRESGLGGYYGEAADGAGALFGRWAEVTLYFALHLPPALGGEGCHALYEGLCDLLLLTRSGFGFYQMSCGPIAYDGAGGANTLRVTAALRAAVTHTDQSLRIGSFDVRQAMGDEEMKA